MNSHRFIEEENAVLKERIRVLEEALEEANDFIKEAYLSEARRLIQVGARDLSPSARYTDLREKIEASLTPQPKE